MKLDTTLPLFPDDLFPDDRRRALAHGYQSQCPACGGRLGDGILEFIEG